MSNSFFTEVFKPAPSADKSEPSTSASVMVLELFLQLKVRNYLVLIKIHRIYKTVNQSLPLFPLCHIKFTEAVNEKCYLFSCKQGLVHFLLQNADFKLAFGFLQLVQSLLGGRSKNPCLNGVEHIVNTFFRFCKLLFQKRQIGAFFLLQLHQRINQSFHDFIIHNCFHTVIERTYKLEETEAVMQEQIRVANHRIVDLEKQMEG